MKYLLFGLMSGIDLLYGLLGHTLGLLPVELSLYFEIVINKYNSSVSFFYLVSPYYDRELFYDTEFSQEKSITTVIAVMMLLINILKLNEVFNFILYSYYLAALTLVVSFIQYST